MLKTFLPHNLMERRVFGLRDSPPIIPNTYKRYQQKPDGTVVFLGEFPIPEDFIYFHKENRGDVTTNTG